MKKPISAVLIFVAAFLVSVVIVASIKIVEFLISEATARLRGYFAEFLQP